MQAPSNVQGVTYTLDFAAYLSMALTPEKPNLLKASGVWNLIPVNKAQTGLQLFNTPEPNSRK